MLYFCSKNHLCFMIDAAALSTTKMNPPETSQSKKFRRKKRSSFQSMTFLWLSHIFLQLLFWKNPPKNGGEKSWPAVSQPNFDDFKICRSRSNSDWLLQLASKWFRLFSVIISFTEQLLFAIQINFYQFGL